MKYKVTTRFNNDQIIQELDSVFNGTRERLYMQILRLQEDGVRDALIKLGWTPPAKEKPEVAFFAQDKTP